MVSHHDEISGVEAYEKRHTAFSGAAALVNNHCVDARLFPAYFLPLSQQARSAGNCAQNDIRTPKDFRLTLVRYLAHLGSAIECHP